MQLLWVPYCTHWGVGPGMPQPQPASTMQFGGDPPQGPGHLGQSLQPQGPGPGLPQPQPRSTPPPQPQGPGAGAPHPQPRSTPPSQPHGPGAPAPHPQPRSTPPPQPHGPGAPAPHPQPRSGPSPPHGSTGGLTGGLTGGHGGQAAARTRPPVPATTTVVSLTATPARTGSVAVRRRAAGPRVCAGGHEALGRACPCRSARL